MSTIVLASNAHTPVPSNETLISLYGYTPSLALSLFALLFFLLFTLYSIASIFRWPYARIISLLLALASFFEFIAYAARVPSSADPFLAPAFAVPYVCQSLAPVILSTAVYLAFAVLIDLSPRNAALCCVSPGIFTVANFAIGAFAAFLQFLGSVLASASVVSAAQDRSTTIDPAAALNLLAAGCAFSFITSIVFAGVFGHFLFSFFRSDAAVAAESGMTSEKRWVPPSSSAAEPDLWLLLAVGTSSTLLFLGHTYRLARASNGFFSDLSTHEAYFIVLDFLPVFLACVCWIACPVGWRVKLVIEAETHHEIFDKIARGANVMPVDAAESGASMKIEHLPTPGRLEPRDEECKYTGQGGGRYAGATGQTTEPSKPLPLVPPLFSRPNPYFGSEASSDAGELHDVDLQRVGVGANADLRRFDPEVDRRFVQSRLSAGSTSESDDSALSHSSSKKGKTAVYTYNRSQSQSSVWED